MKTTYLYVIIALLIVSVGYLFYSNSKKAYVQKSVFADYIKAQLLEKENDINSADTTVVVEEGDEVA